VWPTDVFWSMRSLLNEARETWLICTSWYTSWCKSTCMATTSHECNARIYQCNFICERSIDILLWNTRSNCAVITILLPRLYHYLSSLAVSVQYGRLSVQVTSSGINLRRKPRKKLLGDLEAIPRARESWQRFSGLLKTIPNWKSQH